MPRGAVAATGRRLGANTHGWRVGAGPFRPPVPPLSPSSTPPKQSPPTCTAVLAAEGSGSKASTMSPSV
jgi:hypothetical protein